MAIATNSPAYSKAARFAFVSSLLCCAVWLFAAGCADHRPPFSEWQSPEKGVIAHGDERFDTAAYDGESGAQLLADRSSGCISCHKGVGEPHGGNVRISCVDCHGGDGKALTIEEGHPKASFPDRWPKGGANPERSYTLTMKENWDWIRFVNPGDLRVARTTCAPCHENHTLNVSKSVMTTASHFWAVAAYANGIVSEKRAFLGESYSPEGRLQRVNHLIRTEDGGWRPPTPKEIEDNSFSFGLLLPMPRWEIMQPGNVFRVFEQGSRLGGPALGFNGAPIPLVGVPDKLEDPGRPNNRLSDRGLGTLNRVDLPVLNIHKTRLNDPYLSFFGTNDQPGDYRGSGCTACHMVYANDRSPTHSGKYAKYGNRGLTRPDNPDPTIPKDQRGHPLEHKLTSAIPSSQCMVCHHHQPNSFVNSYYGFTMWTYDADAELLFPRDERDLSHEEFVQQLLRNPEEAALKGKWGDRDFLDDSAVTVNPKAKHTQFADYHSHGWMFRAAFKMDRKGNLLDKNGQVIPYDDPDKFKGVYPLEGIQGENADFFKPASEHVRRAVHLKDIHAEKGMHCVDCHFTYDAHNDGNVYSEYQAAVEIRCQDCHGTVTQKATLGPATGPAAQAPGHFSLAPERLADLRTPWGEPVFFRKKGKIYQRSMVEENRDPWEVRQVRDAVTPGSPNYNPKAAYAKTIRKDNRTWGQLDSMRTVDLAHQDSKMECYACHTSWITACFGCHLPQRANMKTPSNHFEGDVLRNFATYNPQVVRDAEFLLGVSGNVKGNTIAPVRSSSAVLISSEDGQRRRIYGAIPTMGANGMSSQLFNTHFPHTVRTTETRTCDDCHVSEANDNNAWLAQVMLLGTNQVGYMGPNCWVGAGEDGVYAVRTAEWVEPQAVKGSKLHSLAYPEEFEKFVEGGRILHEFEEHPGNVRSLQLRGEYLYTAGGEKGVVVYDVANVFNKDFSEKIVTAPVSPLGQDIHVPTAFATAVALPINNRTSMSRRVRDENMEQVYIYRGRKQNLHESYRYLYVTDRYEGLILVDVDCLTDGNPQNNFIERVVTFNPGGALDGAENLAVAGTTVYVCCKKGLVAVDISDPLEPRIIAEVPAPLIVNPRSVAVQFRYAFVCDDDGVKVVDITFPERMKLVQGASVAIPDARDIYVAKTYGYVSAGAQGLVILDLERPESPSIQQIWNAGGAINDLNQVKIAMTNDSVYAYLADGKNGLKVAAMVTPGDGPRSPYGWAPPPMPELIASFPESRPALAISKALDRDRAVDESGHQMTLFGRIGGRPMNLEEMRRLYIRDGQVYRVRKQPTTPVVAPGRKETVVSSEQR